MTKLHAIQALSLAATVFCTVGCNNGTILDSGSASGLDPSETGMGTDGESNFEKGNKPGQIPTTEPGPEPEPGVPLVTIEFSGSTAELLNPERGFYVGYNLVGASASSAADIRARGHSLAIALVRLDAYRTTALPASFLTSLETGFRSVRGAGLKVVLRFMYNSGYEADASRAQILAHLTQLAPVLAANSDVISVVQAGMIGAWGEWHSSTNGLENDADRTAILNALLAAVPVHRSVQIRTPMVKEKAFPGGPLLEDEAYTESSRARVGHHNDCFLASASDYGTYASPVDYWEGYSAEDGRFTAIGGETCAIYEPKTNCATAVETMRAGHWSYLNAQYNRDVLAVWETDGCDGEIRDRLGYRFSLVRASHTERVAPGGELLVDVDLVNSGFASVYNRRPVELVLTDGTNRRVVKLAEQDVRRWAPGDTTKLSARLRIPADLPAGTYALALRLPDDAGTLAADARYAIQLANDGVWDAATGDNVITRGLVVDADAPGPRDLTARAFTEL